MQTRSSRKRTRQASSPPASPVLSTASSRKSKRTKKTTDDRVSPKTAKKSLRKDIVNETPQKKTPQNRKEKNKTPAATKNAPKSRTKGKKRTRRDEMDPAEEEDKDRREQQEENGEPKNGRKKMRASNALRELTEGGESTEQEHQPQLLGETHQVQHQHEAIPSEIEREQREVHEYPREAIDPHETEQLRRQASEPTHVPSLQNQDQQHPTQNPPEPPLTRSQASNQKRDLRLEFVRTVSRADPSSTRKATFSRSFSLPTASLLLLTVFLLSYLLLSFNLHPSIHHSTELHSQSGQGIECSRVNGFTNLCMDGLSEVEDSIRAEARRQWAAQVSISREEKLVFTKVSRLLRMLDERSPLINELNKFQTMQGLEVLTLLSNDENGKGVEQVVETVRSLETVQTRSKARAEEIQREEAKRRDRLQERKRLEEERKDTEEYIRTVQDRLNNALTSSQATMSSINVLASAFKATKQMESSKYRSANQRETQAEEDDEEDVTESNFTDLLKRYVSRESQLYLADAVGMVDISQPKERLMVLQDDESWTAPTYSPECDQFLRIFAPGGWRCAGTFRALWYREHPILPPESVFQLANHPRPCWTFKGSQGNITVAFKDRKREMIRGIGVEHRRTHLEPLHDASTAPSHVRLYGLAEGFREEHVADVYFDVDGPPIQHALAQEEHGPFIGFKAVVLNNTGAPYTCLQRLRIF